MMVIIELWEDRDEGVVKGMKVDGRKDEFSERDNFVEVSEGVVSFSFSIIYFYVF